MVDRQALARLEQLPFALDDALEGDPTDVPKLGMPEFELNTLVDDFVSLDEAAKELDIGWRHLRRLVILGQFQSAARLGPNSAVIVLHRGEVDVWRDEHVELLAWRVPRPRGRIRLDARTLPEFLDETLPNEPFVRMTIERRRDAAWPRIGSPISRPRVVHQPDADLAPVIPCRLAVGSFQHGYPWTGYPGWDWTVSYGEIHPECVVLGGPQGRAAIRPDHTNLAGLHEVFLAAAEAKEG